VAGARKRSSRVRASAGEKAGAKKSAGAKANGRKVDLEALRTRILNHVGNKAFDIVKNTSDRLTKTINVAAMKFLFEMIGLFPVGAVPVEPRDDETLAAMLLSRLGLPEAEESGPGEETPAIELAESTEAEPLALHAVE
jgi:hypothetical protein